MFGSTTSVCESPPATRPSVALRRAASERPGIQRPGGLNILDTWVESRRQNDFQKAMLRNQQASSATSYSDTVRASCCTSLILTWALEPGPAGLMAKLRTDSFCRSPAASASAFALSARSWRSASLRSRISWRKSGKAKLQNINCHGHYNHYSECIIYNASSTDCSPRTRVFEVVVGFAGSRIAQAIATISTRNLEGMSQNIYGPISDLRPRST